MANIRLKSHQMIMFAVTAVFSSTLLAAETKIDPHGRVDIRAVGDAGYIGDWSEFLKATQDIEKSPAQASNTIAKPRPGNEMPPKFLERRLAHFLPLMSPDINILNLEASLTRTCEAFLEKEFTFATLPSSVAGLVKAGFNVIGLANNHSIDCVSPNMRNEIEPAISAVKKIAPNVVFHGVARNAAKLREVAIREVNGVRIGIVSIKGWAMGAKQNVGNLSNRRMIFAALRDAPVDVRILLLHGGVESERNPSIPMIRTAREFIAEYKGDLVFGHHPHVMQGMELLTRQDGRTAAAFYSLGNFLHDGLSRAGSGMQAQVVVTKQGLDPTHVRVVPLANASWRPGPLDPSRIANAKKHIEASNDFLAETIVRRELLRRPIKLESEPDHLKITLTPSGDAAPNSNLTKHNQTLTSSNPTSLPSKKPVANPPVAP